MINFYIKNGYLICKNLLDKNLINETKEEILQVFCYYNKKKYKNLEDACFNLFEKDYDSFITCAKASQKIISLKNIFFSKEILKILHKLGLKIPSINTEPIVHYSSKYTAKNDFYWKVPFHQDWPSNQGSLNGITCWIPFQKTNKKLGALELVPKSHLWGSLEHKYEGIPVIKNTNFVNKKIKIAEMEIGDVLFFNTFLVHKSGINKTKKIRLSSATRYNDLAENTFIERNYPNHPENEKRMANTNFPNKKQLKKAINVGI